MKLSESLPVLENVTKRRGYANAVYGVADYLALPLGMLLTAPFLLKHLGAAQYGVWILACAAVSSGGTVSASFGDAAIKYVGECRGRQDWRGVTHVVRNMISINLTLSSILAIALWSIAPFVTRHIVKVDLPLQVICLQSLRIGSVLLLVKSLESVFISTLRAFETYGSTVRIAICTRIAALISAVLLVWNGHNVVWIMVATLTISVFGMLAQALALRNQIGSFSPLPSWHRKTVSDIASFGTFSWLQAISGVAFNQADRFFVGFFMGAPAVAYYGLCVQAAQPVHGLIASGMHFLFPHLSARYTVTPISEIRRKVALAIKVNLILVGILSIPVAVFGRHILALWLGPAFGQQPPFMLATIACGFAFLGMNVTAHYALLAVGHVRVVTYLNLLAGIVMLLLMVVLIRGFGLQGAALARLVYGPITCLAYFQLYRVIWRPGLTPIARSVTYEAAATGTD
ncbi:MAG TPA: oligosaccharide flippase family protein [Edaphobacter sp.]|nr:oligosaccharide flippase family protein [Edaphobacter sp.]